MKFAITNVGIKNAVITIEGERQNEADPMNLERKRIEDPEILTFQFDLNNNYAHTYIFNWLNRQKMVTEGPAPTTYREAIDRIIGTVVQAPKAVYRVGF